MPTITEQYFAILKDYFQILQKYTKENGLKASECLCDIYNQELIKGTLLTLIEELESLDWESQKIGIDALCGTKSVYLGNAYLYNNTQNNTEEFLKKTALYADTLIINEPILSELLSWEKRGTGDLSAFNLVAQYALRLLAMEDLFDTHLNPPICYLAPCSVLCLGQGVYGPADQFIHERIVPSYAGKIFCEKFDSYEELIQFLTKYTSFEDFIADVRKSNVPFVNPDGTPVTKKEFLKVKGYYDDKYEGYFELPEALFLLLRGRFSAPAYDLMVNGRYATCFATDFEGVWNNFVWLLNNDNNEVSSKYRPKALSRDSLVLHTMNNEKLKWLGNIPLEKIVEMRERGELLDMRELLSRCISEIEDVSDEEFLEVSKDALYRLQQAFRKHSSEMNELNSTFKRKYNIKLASIAVTGSLGIASAMFPPLAQSIGLLSSGLIETVSISKLIADYFDERDSIKALKRRPIGLLFDAYKG